MSMQSRIFSSISAAAIAATLAACDGSARREGVPQAKLEIVRVDAQRNRLWVLDPEALTLYDNLNGRRLRRVALPELFLVGDDHACPPDIALDAAGAVLVSSNVLPVLWRVDPQRFEVTRIELAMDADTDKDFGFTGLSFAGDDVLIAAASTFASLWRIDIRTASATKIASYPASTRACDPAVLLQAGRERSGIAVAVLPAAAKR
jgi:hypothetical protein